MKLTAIHSPIKVKLPSTRQQYAHDCGVGLARSFARYYYGKNGADTADFIKACETTAKNGTSPADLIATLEAIGLKTTEIHNLTIPRLKEYIGKGKGVIVLIQAWGNKKDYHKNNNGHYVGVIGYDPAVLYFEDPALTGKRGKLKFSDFLARWHDTDKSGKNYIHYGIVVRGDRQPQEESDLTDAVWID
jgi:predicted double-glycine peptidase